MALCRSSRESFFAWRSAVDTLRGFLAPRFISALLVVVAAVGIVSVLV